MKWEFTATSGNKGKAKITHARGGKGFIEVIWETPHTQADSEEFEEWLIAKQFPDATVDMSLHNPTKLQYARSMEAFFADKPAAEQN